ncbi:hypothetical protein D3C87_2117690 [compost metagenome]
MFSEPNSAAFLTEWDKAYLEGLYDAQRTQKNLRAGTAEIESSIRRAHSRLAAEAETTTD